MKRLNRIPRCHERDAEVWSQDDTRQPTSGRAWFGDLVLAAALVGIIAVIVIAVAAAR